MRPFLLSLPCLLPLAGLAAAVSIPAIAASDLDKAMNPYAANVAKALAPPPGEPGSRGLQANDAGNESATCRRLRLQMEASRSGPPPSSAASGFISGGTRDGRPVNVSGGSVDYGETGKLEARYLSECR